jgi:hypothetical protein
VPGDPRGEVDSARLADGTEHLVQRIDRQRAEQRIRLRQWRAADDRDRRRLLGEFVRQTLDAAGLEPGDLLDLV